MLTRSVYEGLLPWPRGYWDDWLREPPQRRGRHTLRPEVSRTFHFGNKGGTSGNIYSAYLDSIQLSTADIRWSEESVEYLKRATYDEALKERLAAARVVQAGAAKESAAASQVRILCRFFRRRRLFIHRFVREEE